MKRDFESGFADFLEERLGSVLFALREKNADYRKLSDEHVVLLNNKYHSVEEYRQAIVKITEGYGKIADIEKRYLFPAGMREHARMKGTLWSNEFKKLFYRINFLPFDKSCHNSPCLIHCCMLWY